MGGGIGLAILILCDIEQSLSSTGIMHLRGICRSGREKGRGFYYISKSKIQSQFGICVHNVDLRTAIYTGMPIGSLINEEAIVLLALRHDKMNNQIVRYIHTKYALCT